MAHPFPAQQPGTLYLTEGGQETEIMYKFGHALPEFAMFTLLDQPRAMADVTAMYQRYLETAVAHGCVPLMAGLDYRASPDWAALLGYSPTDLAEFQHRCIQFLWDVAKPYVEQLPGIRYAGAVGPRGDAYRLNLTITAEDADEYHSVQLETLSQTGIDLVTAMTFNNIPEAVGVARAAARLHLPLTVSFTLDRTGRLPSGPSLKEAVEEVDRQAGAAKPAFYGINCSHPTEFEPALVPGPWVERIRSLRPNAAIVDKLSLCQLGHLESGDPAELGQQLGALAARYPHIDIWGGCCGTWDSHLDAIARRVRVYRH